MGDDAAYRVSPGFSEQFGCIAITKDLAQQSLRLYEYEGTLVFRVGALPTPVLRLSAPGAVQVKRSLDAALVRVPDPGEKFYHALCIARGHACLPWVRLPAAERAQYARAEQHYETQLGRTPAPEEPK